MLPGDKQRSQEVLQRFLLQEGIEVPWHMLWVDPIRQRLSALCYVQRGDQVLMLQRRKQPFSGYWTAPGGKLEPGEDPRQAIRREIQEETGLHLRSANLQLVVSERSPDPLYNWLLFVFRSEDAAGQLTECQEGLLRWVPLTELATLKRVTIDSLLLPFVYDDRKRYIIHVVFEHPPEGEIVRTEAFSRQSAHASSGGRRHARTE
ncbi:MAG: NUDIX hydrolase [Limnochordia bacterium]